MLFIKKLKLYKIILIILKASYNFDFNLNKSIERIKRNNRYLVGGGAVCAIAFVVCLLVK